MLTHRDLTQLASNYRDLEVLSVYLHTSVENPAERHRWQAELDRALSVLEDQLSGASHQARAELASAIARLRRWLLTDGNAMNAPGVLVIVSPEAVLQVTATDTVVPNVAWWGKGVHLAPLLKEASLGPVASVLVLDARSAHLYRFEPSRNLQRVDTLVAPALEDFERHMGAPTGRMHAGTRGPTASDEADRIQLAARHRLYEAALHLASEIAAPDGWMVLAGAPRSVAAASNLVPNGLAWRKIELEHVDVHLSEFELARTVAAAINRREAERDTEVVRAILDEHGSRGRGVAGLEATRASLQRAGVATLILSEHFVEQHGDEADVLVASALQQGATVRRVEGDAAQELDRHAEGVMARLRYRMRGAEEHSA